MYADVSRVLEETATATLDKDNSLPRAEISLLLLLH
jgi:hypothetical protein